MTCRHSSPLSLDTPKAFPNRFQKTVQNLDRTVYLKNTKLPQPKQIAFESCQRSDCWSSSVKGLWSTTAASNISSTIKKALNSIDQQQTKLQFPKGVTGVDKQDHKAIPFLGRRTLSQTGQWQSRLGTKDSNQTQTEGSKAKCSLLHFIMG